MLGIASRTVASRAWVAFRVVGLDGWRLLMVTLESHTKDTRNATRKREAGLSKDTTIHFGILNNPLVHLGKRGLALARCVAGVRFFSFCRRHACRYRSALSLRLVVKPRILVAAGLAFSLFANAPLLAQGGHKARIKTETLSLTDAARNREVPLTIYTDAAQQVRAPKLAIIGHGYGGKNTDYGFIATYLATHGYYVASIQHEIPGDEPLPSTGKPYDTRMPSWKRGVENILFVIAELKKRQPDLDAGNLLLVGHSHGGDTSMLFAQEHPDLVDIVISLDNRRMPFPRTKKPRLFSLRSSDQAADEGVIPSPEEQAKFGTKVVKLPATLHNDMWDGGTAEQKAEMIRYIAEFLRESGEQDR